MWLDKHPGNVSYMSAEIQNEMIMIISRQIVEAITHRKKVGRWFAVCADKTAENKTEQVSQILHYVY